MKRTRIAVYGSLLSGLGNHDVIKRHIMRGGAEFVAEDTIRGFNLYAVSSFPGIKRHETDPTKEVKVELYDVDESALRSVRMLEGYNPESDHNTFYDEIETPTDSHGNVKVYLYMPKIYEQDLVEHGDWRKFVRTRYR